MCHKIICDQCFFTLDRMLFKVSILLCMPYFLRVLYFADDFDFCTFLQIWRSLSWLVIFCIAFIREMK